ncbi:MAG: hypothetical protein Q9227_006909 [Pyrenula ochraceoflavens]
MKFVSSIFVLVSLPLALGKVGGSCTYNDIQGTCQDTGKCTAGKAGVQSLMEGARLIFHTGFVVDNYCPDDGPNIKCCLSKSCTNTKGDAGTCLNKGRSLCTGAFVTGRCPGPSDVQCCVGGGSSSSSGQGGGSPASPTAASSPENDVVIDFWIKAFIPLSVDGVTKTYPKDHSKSMINGIPIIGGCFLTDQRGFSNAVGSSARMTSETWVWIKPGLPSGFQWSQHHYCGQTEEVDCGDGDVEAKKTQNADNMAFGVLSGSDRKVVLDFKAAESNPLVAIAPNIDLKGTLTVDRVGRYVEFVGKVDDFPAFEAYVSINGGNTRTIAQLGPKPGAGPTSLLGDANRDFRGRVSF